MSRATKGGPEATRVLPKQLATKAGQDLEVLHSAKVPVLTWHEERAAVVRILRLPPRRPARVPDPWPLTWLRPRTAFRGPQPVETVRSSAFPEPRSQYRLVNNQLNCRNKSYNS